MSLLQRKCLLYSVSLHGLMFLVLLIGAAFVSSHSQVVDSSAVITLIPPAFLTDRPGSGGGKPARAVAPPSHPREAPSPPRTEPRRSHVEKVTPPPPSRHHEARAVTPVHRKSRKPVRTRPRRQEIVPNLTPVVRSDQNSAERRREERRRRERAQAEAKARAKALAARESAVHHLVTSLRTQLSSTTTITVPGTGGARYANYGQYVQSLYQHAWLAPTELSSDSAVVTARVVIARDGHVISHRIIKRSGVPALDRSVQDALDRVTNIGYPFPEGAKEDQRTFLIDFNLKSRMQNG